MKVVKMEMAMKETEITGGSPFHGHSVACFRRRDLNLVEGILQRPHQHRRQMAMKALHKRMKIEREVLNKQMRPEHTFSSFWLLWLVYAVYCPKFLQSLLASVYSFSHYEFRFVTSRLWLLLFPLLPLQECTSMSLVKLPWHHAFFFSLSTLYCYNCCYC